MCIGNKFEAELGNAEIRQLLYVAFLKLSFRSETKKLKGKKIERQK